MNGDHDDDDDDNCSGEDRKKKKSDLCRPALISRENFTDRSLIMTLAELSIMSRDANGL